MTQRIHTLTGSPQPQTWHVLGAGAMGCLWASALAAQAGAERIELLVRDQQTLAGYPGFVTLEDNTGGLTRLPIRARIPDTDLPMITIQHLLLATKAHDAATAMASVKPALNHGSHILMLQNGLRSHLEIASEYPEQAVFALSTSHGAWLRKPFHVVHAGRGLAWLGNLRGSNLPDSLLAALPVRDMNIQSDPMIRSRLWQKFAVNCAINGLTALYDCPNGELVTRADRRQRLLALCREIESILKQLPDCPAIAELEPAVMQVIETTAANFSSTVQDTRRGRRTEIQEFNGYLCALAEQHHLPCPLNRQIFEAVQALENRTLPG